MPAAHCGICLNHFAIDSGKLEFIIFLCGHGFCSSCSDRLFADARAKCPHCRKSIHRRDGHPVYLELVDSEKLVAQNIVEGLDKMDVDTPLVSIKKAGQKLRHATEGASTDSRLQMLKAMEDLSHRITPAFEKLESQKREIDKLHRDVQKSYREKDTLQSKLRELEGLVMEVTRLKKSLDEADSTTEQALRLAEISKDQMEKEHRTTERYRASVQAMESENKRLRDANERYKSNAQSDREKYKKLHNKYTALKDQRRIEESQVVPETINDYDADFSGHEGSRIHNIQATIISSPSRSARQPYSNENEVELDFEGMPPPKFTPDWQFDGSVTGVLKKRVPNGVVVPSHRRVANSFPIELDRKGRPTKSIQLGPRSTIHVRR